jgi:Tfp pilus assembly protein PilF
VRWQTSEQTLNSWQEMSAGDMEFKNIATALLATVMISLPHVGSSHEHSTLGYFPAQSGELPEELEEGAPKLDIPDSGGMRDFGETSDEDVVAGLLEELAQADTANSAQRLENRVMTEWSKSGSAAMDLLLKRGRDALEVEDLEAAAEHFRALTDHAPDFAEGWHGLALTYYEQEHLGLAMDALERVLALNPNHFGALRGVAAIHEQTGQEALAYEAYEQVLALRPHDPDIERALSRLEVRVKGVEL